MFSTTASMPPFAWKDPIPTKDYMRENFQHIRKLAQSKKPKSDGLRPNFIPGVTKNPKYDHVPSRVAEFLRAGGEGKCVAFTSKSLQSSASSSTHSRLAPVKAIPARSTRSSEKPSLSANEDSKPIWGASVAANAKRLSRSTTDLSQKPKTPAPTRNHSLRRKQPLQVQNESVYNWRFSDANFPQSVGSQADSRIPSDKFMHRVEYLPCDGICAEETLPVKEEPGQDDSARSSSSSRTSRGVNTDETRIFQHSSLKNPFMKPILKDSSILPSGLSRPARSTSHEDFQFLQGHRQNHKPSEREDSGIETDFFNLTLDNKNAKHHLATDVSASSSTKINSQSTNAHRLGAVPGYLKQRKQQWQDEADAKKEAERNSDVPRGHVLMTNSERLETLKTVKANYDQLIAEFNRLPVGVDTLRVREEKKRIEDNLTKLEQAVKIFSRPRVFVKMDQ